MEIFAASHQWATRPADERFPSLEAMHHATQSYADKAAEAVRPWSDLKVVADDGDVSLSGPTGTPAKLTHYAFNQLAARANAPASFLRTLPAPLAADVLADRLTARPDQRNNAQILFHQNGGLVVRALTTDNYVRIWNHEVIARLVDLSKRFGLVPGRQTFAWDGSPLPPESERPASLYASDHDMFAFLMSSARTMIDPVGQPMHKGVIVQNSEVGDCALKIMGFWFRDVCCNHIIWGARELTEVRLTHVGQIRSRWIDASLTVRRYLDEDTSRDAARFQETTVPIAGDKNKVLDLVFAKRIPELTRKALAAGFEAVVPEQDGDPRSKWGLAQGLTRFSQTQPYGDERQGLDRAAGKLLQVAF